MTSVSFRDDFDGADLDRSVWFPHYLPAWSSRHETRAAWRVADSALTLSIPAEHPRWCPDEHVEPLRVSGIQSGNRSGPVGSNDAQQRFRDDLIVREAQPRFEGWLPSSGRVEIRMRMDLSVRSMAAMWLAGFEEDPAEGGELCVVEVFGREVDTRCSAEVGVGIKAIHDPRLSDDFVTPRLDLDVGDDHTYAVEWDRSAATFSVDGNAVHTSPNPPTYPMQAMIAVFDFPSWGPDAGHVPTLSVDWIEARDLA
jgi:hypothetical protein